MGGDTVLAELLEGQNLFISIITEMELYAYHGNNSASLQILDSFLQAVSVINIEERVKTKAISIRKSTKLKLPDCIISASAWRINFL
jgi:predicted nucleic acid-binding protein